MPAVNTPENRETLVLQDLPPLPSPERVQELLFEAARLGRDDLIPVLLEAGADIEAADAKGHTALVLATYNGFETTAELLLGHGADPNGTTTSGSPLMGVAFKGHIAIARRLLAAGADPNLRNAAGQTAVMMGALFDRREIVALLLDAGADGDAVDAAGNDAPVWHACRATKASHSGSPGVWGTAHRDSDAGSTRTIIPHIKRQERYS